MKYVVSRYNQPIEWLSDYTEECIIYDRSEDKIKWAIPTENIGSDIYDKFTFIIDYYDDLPEVAVYTKANLFKYISEEEFKGVCNNGYYTPLLTKHHKTYSDQFGQVCFYKDGIYWERNNMWYLGAHSPKSIEAALELMGWLKIKEMFYVPFAPGSNYILTRENIRKHPREFYKKLRSYLEWDKYPGEAMVMERGLHTLWK